MNVSMRAVAIHLFAAPLMLLGLSAGGCSREKPVVDPNLKGTLVIKGSNTFGEELGPALIAEYRRQRPNVAVDLESKGSGSGFAAMINGQCAVAASSRPPSDEELARARERGVGLREHIIGYYGVAVIVNVQNPVGELSREHVRSIFTGVTKNWKDVGGTDVPIHVCIRDPASGTNLGFRELAMDNRPYADGAAKFSTYADLATAVAKDSSGIGYSSMHLANVSGVKAVRIGRQLPNTLSVNEGWYPYTRTIRLFTNASDESALARDFVRFVQRNAGQRIIEELGFVRRFEQRLDSIVPD